MSTTLDDPTTEATPVKRKRKKGAGKQAKPSYLKERNLKSIAVGTKPAVPDEFDPDRHGPLNQLQFEDVLDFNRHMKDVLEFRLAKVNKKISSLEKLKPEDRAGRVKIESGIDQMAAHFRKMRAEGKSDDLAELIAKVQAEFAAAMTG